MMGSPAGIICHGGAGYHSKENEYKLNLLMQKACDAALSTKSDFLENGLSAAMSILERSPLTNCGAIGGNLDRNGDVTADVGIMIGDYSYGAVGALPCRVKTDAFDVIYEPHLLALDLMSKEKDRNDYLGRIPPLLLVGDKAYDRASKLGIVHRGLDPITKTTRLKWLKHRSWMNAGEGEDKIMDTVGVIVFDDDGNVISGVSSCGMSLKEPGRVGEAAVFGAGLWSQNLGLERPALGFSASGQGEQLIKTCLGRSSWMRLGSLGQNIQNQVLGIVTTDFLESPLLSSYKPEQRDMGFILYHLEEKNNNDFGELWYAVKTFE